jgi:hypothetical protein
MPRDASVTAELRRRGFVQLLAGTGTAAVAVERVAASLPASSPPVDDHTTATYKAVVDAIVPPRQYAAPDGEPGALAVDLHEALIHLLNGTFETPTPVLEPAVDARLAESIAALLDAAAGELLAAGENEAAPEPDRFPGGGPFATLARGDRLRAMGRFDRGGDERVIAHVLCTYTTLLYYSEWAGYDEFDVPPAERDLEGDVQGWEQCGYPGPAAGYAALRGYRVQRFREDRP